VKAVYYDSVEDKATELCFFDEYDTAPPAMVNTKPDTDSGSSSPPQCITPTLQSYPQLSIEYNSLIDRSVEISKRMPCRFLMGAC